MILHGGIIKNKESWGSATEVMEVDARTHPAAQRQPPRVTPQVVGLAHAIQTVVQQRVALVERLVAAVHHLLVAGTLGPHRVVWQTRTLRAVTRGHVVLGGENERTAGAEHVEAGLSGHCLLVGVVEDVDFVELGTEGVPAGLGRVAQTLSPLHLEQELLLSQVAAVVALVVIEVDGLHHVQLLQEVGSFVHLSPRRDLQSLCLLPLFPSIPLLPLLDLLVLLVIPADVPELFWVILLGRSEIGDGEVVVEFEDVVAYFEAVPDGFLVLLAAQVEEGRGCVDVEVVALPHCVLDVITLDPRLEQVGLLLGGRFAAAAAVLAALQGGTLATAYLLTVSSSEGQPFVQVQEQPFLKEEEEGVDPSAVDVEVVVELFQSLPAVGAVVLAQPLEEAVQKSSQNVQDDGIFVQFFVESRRTLRKGQLEQKLDEEALHVCVGERRKPLPAHSPQIHLLAIESGLHLDQQRLIQPPAVQSAQQQVAVPQQPVAATPREAPQIVRYKSVQEGIGGSLCGVAQRGGHRLQAGEGVQGGSFRLQVLQLVDLQLVRSQQWQHTLEQIKQQTIHPTASCSAEPPQPHAPSIPALTPPLAPFY